jgi:hypothetical protein
MINIVHYIERWKGMLLRLSSRGFLIKNAVRHLQQKAIFWYASNYFYGAEN